MNKLALIFVGVAFAAALAVVFTMDNILSDPPYNNSAATIAPYCGGETHCIKAFPADVTVGENIGANEEKQAM